MKRSALLSILVLAAATGLLGDGEFAESRKSFLAARSAVADGRYQEALELYRKVLLKIPSDPVVRLEYAQLLRDLNVGDEATREAREAVRLDPELPEARRLLGALELSAAEKDPSRLSEAIEQLTAARRLAPADIGTSVSLARALLAADRSAEAAAILDELPELRNQPMIQRLTAEAKARVGRYKEAEALYRALAEADPGDREIAAALIDIYEDQDKIDQALEMACASSSSATRRIRRSQSASSSISRAPDGSRRRRTRPASSWPGARRTGRPAGCWRRSCSSEARRRRARRS